MKMVKVNLYGTGLVIRQGRYSTGISGILKLYQQNGDTMKKQAKNIIEPEKKTTVFSYVDVVVCGSGSAEIVAAVSASKNGATTLFLERYGFLSSNGFLN